jgi:hypothetical protein
MILLYSYIRPVFSKKNQEKPSRNSRETSHTVVDSEHTKRYKSRRTGDGVRRLFPHLVGDSDGKTSINAADTFPK